MNTTTYGIESPSGEGIQVVSETVFVGNPEEYLSEKCCPAMTLEEVMDARGVSTDIEKDVQMIV